MTANKHLGVDGKHLIRGVGAFVAVRKIYVGVLGVLGSRLPMIGVPCFSYPTQRLVSLFAVCLSERILTNLFECEGKLILCS